MAKMIGDKAGGLMGMTGNSQMLFGQVATTFGGYGTFGQGWMTMSHDAGMINIMPYRCKTGDWSMDHRVVSLMAMSNWSLYPRMFDPTKPAQVRALIDPADFVNIMMSRKCNLAWIRWRDLDWGYDAIYRLFPVEIAKMAKELGKENYIYLSMIGCNVDSESHTFRSKARAEIELREIFPETMIVRPSDGYSMWGPWHSDLFRFIARTTKDHALLVFPEMLLRRCRPVWTHDLGTAMVYMLRDRQFQGQTFELGGRIEMTWEEILKYICRLCKMSYETIRVPFPVAKFIASIFERVLYYTGLSRDFYIRQQYDSVPAEQDPDILGWADLGIDEREMTIPDEVVPWSVYNHISRGPGQSETLEGMSNLQNQRFMW